MIESLERTTKGQASNKRLESVRSGMLEYLSADFLSKKILGLDVWVRHKWAMSKLRRAFPTDLENPTNKIITINYKWWDLKNFKISLYNYCEGDNSYNSMDVCTDDCGIEICKDWDFWDSSLREYMKWSCSCHNWYINYSKFYEWVNEIIKHKDECKVVVESVFVNDWEKPGD